jgi:chromosomal replication initiation ATPase DnaA
VGEKEFAQRILETPKEETLLIRALEPEWLVEWVSRAERVKLKELTGSGRGRAMSRVRAICGYLGREVARLPLSKVARELNRDGSTLWRDVERLEKEMEKDDRLAARMRKLAKDLTRFQNNT